MALVCAAGRCLAEPSFALTVLHRGDNGAFAVCDVDGNGKPDILAARKPRPLHWLAYPSLESHPIADKGNIWMEIQAADADGDGDCDALAPDMAVNELAWWENPAPKGDPAKGPWTRRLIGTWEEGFPHDFKVGDIDRDGRLDAVLRLKGANAFQVFLQQESGAWAYMRLEGAAGNGEGTALGDLDGDGDLDISDGLVWLEAPADALRGSWTRHDAAPDFGAPMTRVAIVDVDGNGRNDVVVSPSDTSLALAVSWYGSASPRTGPWTRHEIMPAGRADYLHSLQVGDIDGDGHADVLTGSDHRGSKELLIFYNGDKGKGDVWKEQAIETGFGAWQAVLADVDGDGYPDILSADDDNSSQQELRINSGAHSGIHPPAWPGPVREERRGRGTHRSGDGAFLRDFFREGCFFDAKGAVLGAVD